MRHLALLLAVLPFPALACQNDSEVFSCQVGKKVLEICHWKGALIYSFGGKGNPDLTIAEPLETVEFTPWPGIGGSIWETVAFPNKGYTYEVWTSVERDPEATTGLEGGVNVLQGDNVVANLTCDPGTASNSLDVIFALKESIGQCWDFDSQSWQTACSN
jgi:hypothetical protein